MNKFFNKGLISCFALSVGVLALETNAAVVTLTTPDLNASNGGADTYDRFGETYTLYQETSGADLYDPSVNGGEEFILLGAHEPILHGSDSFFNGCTSATCNNEINVNLTNDNGSSPTGGISLLLTASESLIWNVNYDVAAGIDLRSIYIFGNNINGQSLTINGVDVVSNDVLQMGASSINVVVSPDRVCAISYPMGEGGCETQDLLGTDDKPDYLADLTSLKLTEFHAAYHVDQFDIAINSTPTIVPVPSAFFLLVSALAGLAISRRQML